MGGREYWFAVREQKDRKPDIRYVKEHLSGVKFQVFKHNGHGGLAVKKPVQLADELRKRRRELAVLASIFARG